MTEPKKRPRGGKKGSKLNRTETVTLRLDPRLRYLLELAARKQRRTVSSFIEWAIEQSLSHVIVREPNQSLVDAADELWDPDEADRFAKLALTYPELLTYEEEILWKAVREARFLWNEGAEGEKSLDFMTLRDLWDNIQLVASGEIDRHDLAQHYEHLQEIDRQNREASHG